MVSPKLSERIEGLVPHRDRLELGSIQDLFDADEKRFENFSIRFGSLLFDYSKNKIDATALDALLSVARDMKLQERIEAMFSGEHLNVTEGRPALHTALRGEATEPIYVHELDIIPQISEVQNAVDDFANKVRSGTYKVSGKSVTDVVNIGIGGSDLGPRMVVEALAPFHDGPALHFVSNLDGSDLSDTLKKLDPSSTLFIIASKSFNTLETMTNANSAMQIVKHVVGDTANEHFVALSTNLSATKEFGIPEERTFGFWDWVGGRYSVWSAIGLSVAIAIGENNFRRFRQGALSGDQHFREETFEDNIPVIMALIGVWHRNLCGYTSFAMLPYDNRLASFPRWLQQLDMESNGKSVMLDGAAVPMDTAPLVFGEPGTNGQHAFYQMLHQGTDVIPCDFLVAARGFEKDLDHHHQGLVANCFAQSEALMRGRTIEEAQGNTHRVFVGDRPSTTFLYEKLDPETLGLLMALYEHKVFVQGVLWNINSFDQWGVELGKQLAHEISQVITSGDTSEIENASTKGLLNEWTKMRGKA